MTASEPRTIAIAIPTKDAVHNPNASGVVPADVSVKVFSWTLMERDLVVDDPSL